MKYNVKFTIFSNNQISVYSYFVKASSTDDATSKVYYKHIKPMNIDLSKYDHEIWCISRRKKIW